MRRDADGTIVLSERNLLALLDKVRDGSSHRTLFAGRGGANGHGTDPLIVKAETNEEHYAQRQAPGVMSDRSEAFIRDETERRARDQANR